MVDIFILIFIFLFGTIIGSFLNVVIYRFNTGKSMINSRSICMTCNVTLRWYELIPVLSFLFQKGRCRTCASQISHQYPLVEFITAVMFTIIAYHLLPILSVSFGIYLFFLLYFVLIFSILIVISVYDIRHKIIPDKLSYTFTILSLVLMFLHYSSLSNVVFVIPNIWQFLAGPLLALPFFLISYLSGGRLMGMGDPKLILGIGWMLGLSVGASALFIAFFIGAVVGVVTLLLKKFATGLKTEIPFAPFLVLGAFIAFIYNIDFMSLASLFAF